MKQDRYSARQLRKRMWITIIVSALALLTVLLSVSTGAFNFHKGGNAMPDLTGMTEEEAVAAIEKLGGHASVSYEVSMRQKGTVIRQDLPAGETVMANSNVGVVVSGGHENSAATNTPIPLLPNFTGLSMELATASAEQLGVKLEEDGYVYSDDIPYGSIVDQKPAGGAEIHPGDVIKVQISAGPEIVRYTITVDAGPGGTVSPGTTTVKEGSDVTFHITPDEGYEIASIRVDGEEVHLLERYSFLSVDENHTLSVTFQEQKSAIEDLFEQIFGSP